MRLFIITLLLSVSVLSNAQVTFKKDYEAIAWAYYKTDKEEFSQWKDTSINVSIDYIESIITVETEEGQTFIIKDVRNQASEKVNVMEFLTVDKNNNQCVVQLQEFPLGEIHLIFMYSDRAFAFYLELL